MSESRAQAEHASLPLEAGTDALGRTRLPISVLHNGRGPVVALLSVQDDRDCAASLVLHRLIRTLDPSTLQGTLIVLPHVIPPLAADADPTLDTLERRVLSIADITLELLPSGGMLQRIPTLATPLQDRQTEAEALMMAAGFDNSARLPAPSAHSLGARALQHDCLYLCGWVGSNSSGSLALNHSLAALHNLLVQCGVLKAELELRSTRMLRLDFKQHRVKAPRSGTVLPLAELNEDCHADHPLVELIDLDQAAQAPLEVRAPHTGVLWAIHRAGPVEAGDTLAIIAEPMPL